MDAIDGWPANVVLLPAPRTPAVDRPTLARVTPLGEPEAGEWDGSEPWWSTLQDPGDASTGCDCCR